MIRVLYRQASGKIVGNFPIDQLAAALRDSRAYLWVDLSAPTETEQQTILTEVFQFHPLAVEDVTSGFLVPKINDYRRYLFIVVHSIYRGEAQVDLITSELDIFLGANFLVTVHAREMNAIEELLADEAHHDNSGLGQGPAFLLCKLMRQQIQRYSGLLDGFEAELERLGDVLFHQKIAREDVLNDLLTAQTSALRLTRALRPQRELMNRLARDDYGVIPSDARLYFADVDDDLVRMVGLMEGMQALARGTTEMHMALSDIRKDDLMRMLIVILTIFLPLMFLTGIYVRAYPALWVLILAIVCGLFYYFRRMGWLSSWHVGTGTTKTENRWYHRTIRNIVGPSPRP